MTKMIIGSALLILLVLLGAVSFGLFIRRLLINSKVNNNTSNDINQKLDRIIDLLEKQTK